LSQAGTVCKSHRHKYQCVSAVAEMEVPAFICLHSKGNHVTEVDGPYILRDTD